jgi:gliding motility-associated-like protein
MRLLLLLLFSIPIFLFSQSTPISGIVNTYSEVTNIDSVSFCGTIFTLANSSSFSPGDQALLIQMTGAQVNTTNTSAFGQITDYATAGHYEFVTISNVSGSQVAVGEDLLYTYNTSANVQLISVPSYTNAEVTATLTCPAWDGTTGGVIVLAVDDTLTLSAEIQANGKGFQGGTVYTSGGFNCASMAYFYGSTDDRGAEKGKGIALNSAATQRGRGAFANGGGGGNDHNAGGGGGGNAGVGGIGGMEYNGCGSDPNTGAANGGIGGYSVVTDSSRIFMGGGGGAGHENVQYGDGTSGGRGGGIIIILAGVIDGNSEEIRAEGQGVNLLAAGDGAGGGGAGGSVLIQADEVISPLLINVEGGDGGSINFPNTTECSGPGGGGAGGLIAWNTNLIGGANIQTDQNGGDHGINQTVGAPCFNSNYGALEGGSGFTATDWQVAETPIGNPALVDLGPADTLQCVNEQTLLTSGPYPFSDFLWNTGETNDTIYAIGPDTLYLTMTNACGSHTDSIIINVIDTPYVNLGPDTTICVGTTLFLDATGPNIIDYAWNNGLGISPNVAIPFVTTPGALPDTFRIIVQNGACPLDQDSIIVSYDQSYLIDLGPDQVACDGDEVTFYSNLTEPALYQWNDGSMEDSLLVLTSGIYWVDASNAENLTCPSYRDSVEITFYTPPTVDLGPNDTVLCKGANLFLNATDPNATDYLWQDGSTLSTYQVILVTDTYWVEVSNPGCIRSDSIFVFFDQSPEVNIGADTLICYGDTLALGPGIIGSAYEWIDVPTGDTLSLQDTLFVTEASTYRVYATNPNANCGKFFDDIVVTTELPPIPDLGPRDTILCQDSTLLLSPTDPLITEWLWQDGSTASSFLVNSSGTYFVEVRGTDVCYKSDTIDVSFDEAFLVQLPNDTLICDTTVYDIFANPAGYAYTWSNASTIDSLRIFVTGDYWLDVTNPVVSCPSYRDSIFVQIDSIPNVAIQGDTLFCNGDATTLQAVSDAAASFTWNTGEMTDVITLTSGGTYTVIASNNCGLDTASQFMFEDFPPSVSLREDTTLCVGDTILLAPTSLAISPYTSFLWHDSSIDSTYLVTEAGRYVLIVQNDCGIDGAEVNIEYTRDCDPPFAYKLPNAFSPNGDGINDYLSIPQLGFSSFEVRIFDRWGREIYQSQDPELPWDGTYKGADVPEGVYVILVKAVTLSGREIEQAGNVTVVR